jgi:hypothetical protein
MVGHSETIRVLTLTVCRQTVDVVRSVIFGGRACMMGDPEPEIFALRGKKGVKAILVRTAR